MKERPILFSGAMVRAILDGRKTQTRRVVKLDIQKIITDVSGETSTDNADISDVDVAYLTDAWNGPGWYVTLTEYPEEGSYFLGQCPYGNVGDVLWVRETWCSGDCFYQLHENDTPSVVAYRADKSAIRFNALTPHPIPERDIQTWNWNKVTWRPSIFMPRWASRLKLRITDVRVQRLQDISEEDALAEGVEDSADHSHRDWFSRLWDGINGKTYPWESNPWVWAVSFERI